ncbi:MAG TPA: hypothetical protein VG994_09015 [Steroidobacteraceae bacterium]|nr:hypothetical protein [Steroidobacteraceae bacterium]
MHPIIAVTPAGRRRYLRILAHYILSDPSIARWQLWDNCRDPSDRGYLEQLAREHPEKVELVRLPRADGGLRAINPFYATLRDPHAFYIKLDDDVVWLPPRFGEQLLRAALDERTRYTWWSPVVINNALCSWLLKHHSPLQIDAEISAQAGCVHGWRSPAFAYSLHLAFLDAVRAGAVAQLEIPSFPMSLARYSINCLGFFGSEIARLGSRFCPPEVDDEEWLSAILPSRIGRPGRIVGHLLVSHFSFYTQEPYLLQTGVLDEYCRLAGLEPEPTQVKQWSLRRRVREGLLLRLLGGRASYDIQLSAREPERAREAERERGDAWAIRSQP